MVDQPFRRRSTFFWEFLAVAVATLSLMLATGPRLAMVWDEGHVLGRETRIRMWCRALADPPAFAARWIPPRPLDELVPDSLPPPGRDQIDTRSKLLSGPVLRWFWPFAREEPHGHPPFYAIVGMIGDLVVPSWPLLARGRLGPMIVFSLTAGFLFAGVGRDRNRWAGAVAAGAWVFQPQLFALGHYAGYDAILAALWVGAILAFDRALADDSWRRWTGWLMFAVICGWAADTKLTGWFLPLPFALWTLLTRSGRGLRTLVYAAPVALLALYVFNPAWWTDPIGGVVGFFQSNLSRGRTIPIPVAFLGRIYDTPRDSLPWYNTLAWTVMVTPVGFLLLAICGTGRAIAERKSRPPLASLAAMHGAFLLVLRALPHTPGHDGVRQFLPAFGCLALCAGVGASWSVDRWGGWGKLLAVAAITEGIVSVAVMMPVPLAYFSPIVFGLPGATALGMEPTYFWDALSADALSDLARTTPPGRSVRFATFPTSWLYLRRIGAMRFPLAPIDRELPMWYVVQNRPGALSLLDRTLIRRSGPKHVLVEKFGVPLIWAFPYAEFESLQRPAPRAISP